MAGAVSNVKVDNSKGVEMVNCSPLSDMMKLANVTRIDLWSLDVEGFEITVLKGVDFTQVPISVVLIEDFWISNRQLDLLMTSSGFVKYQHMAIDSVFVNRDFMLASPTKVWYPKTFKEDIEQNNAFRIVHKSKMDCT